MIPKGLGTSMTMTTDASRARLRRCLLIAAAALCTATSASATIGIEGGDRSGRDNADAAAPASTDGKTGNASDKQRRKNSERYVVYNRPYLKIVTDRALRNAIKLNQVGGEVVADGFTQEMSVHLFRMLLLLRQRTVNLLDSLENKPTRTARLANLTYEAQIVGRTLAALKSGDTPASAEVTYQLENETESRAIAIKRLTAYEALLYRWMNTPMEGTYRTPGAPDN